jgi:hypothetical protein
MVAPKSFSPSTIAPMNEQMENDVRANLVRDSSSEEDDLVATIRSCVLVLGPKFAR